MPSIRVAEKIRAVGDGAAGFPFKQTSHLASVRGVSCTAERSSPRSALGLTLRTPAGQPRREDCQCAPTDEHLSSSSLPTAASTESSSATRRSLATDGTLRDCARLCSARTHQGSWASATRPRTDRDWSGSMPGPIEGAIVASSWPLTGAKDPQPDSRLHSRQIEPLSAARSESSRGRAPPKQWAVSSFTPPRDRRLEHRPRPRRPPRMRRVRLPMCITCASPEALGGYTPLIMEQEA